MNLAALHTLVATGESLTLELKKSTAEKDRACRSLCALANGQGGQVVFGVTPAGKVVGQKVSERVLNTTRVMPRASYQRLLAESMHATDRWEMQPAVGCDINTLDHNELVVTIEEAIRRGRMEDPGTRDPMGLLRGLGLLVQGDQLSRAAVALFCKDGHAIPEFPQFNLRVARFKGITRDEFLDNRQYAGNAFALMRRAERFLIDWMPVAGKIVPGQMARIDTPALPVEAVREALANAFAPVGAAPSLRMNSNSLRSEGAAPTKPSDIPKSYIAKPYLTSPSPGIPGLPKCSIVVASSKPGVVARSRLPASCKRPVCPCQHCKSAPNQF